MGELHTAFSILAASIGTYGLATLLSDYDGPFNAFRKLRRIGRLFECNTCLGFWILMPISIILGIGLVGYLAALGVVVILTRHL